MRRLANVHATHMLMVAVGPCVLSWPCRGCMDHTRRITLTVCQAVSELAVSGLALQADPLTVGLAAAALLVMMRGQAEVCHCLQMPSIPPDLGHSKRYPRYVSSELGISL